MKNRSILVGLLIWIVFVIFRFMGDYPIFIKSIVELVLEINFTNVILTKFTYIFSLNFPDASWLTARFTVMLGCIFNYTLISIFFSYNFAKVFIVVVIISLTISIISSPFGLIGVRFIMYQITTFLSEPFLLLIFIPIRMVYLDYIKKEEAS